MVGPNLRQRITKLIKVWVVGWKPKIAWYYWLNIIFNAHELCDVADLEGTLSVRKAMITPLTGLFRHLEWTISVHSERIATFSYQWSFRMLLSDIQNMEFVTEIWKKWQPTFLNHEVMHPGPLCIYQWWATTGRKAHRRSLASLR